MHSLNFDIRGATCGARIDTLIAAGWTGRDRVAVEQHIAELAAIGVGRPSTVPCFYRLGANLLTQAPVTDAVGRVKLFKLAWDAVGSEFGSRHLQYEMFYAGANMVTCGHAFRTFDWDQAVGMVDGFMSTYGLPPPETPNAT